MAAPALFVVRRCVCFFGSGMTAAPASGRIKIITCWYYLNNEGDNHGTQLERPRAYQENPG